MAMATVAPSIGLSSSQSSTVRPFRLTISSTSLDKSFFWAFFSLQRGGDARNEKRELIALLALALVAGRGVLLRRHRLHWLALFRSHTATLPYIVLNQLLLWLVWHSRVPCSRRHVSINIYYEL